MTPEERKQIAAVLDAIPKEFQVRIREGGAEENLCASLTVSVTKLIRACSGWQSIDTAPRDGTLIEIKCCWGIAPWFMKCRWGIMGKTKCWVNDDQSRSIIPEADREGLLFWRSLE